tara:strand:+ start:481 stop:708 length:228 start_codon:yes stop_codon:yes gene_type:complete
MLRNKKQPETGIIIEEITNSNDGCRLLVLGDCEFVFLCSKVKGVMMLNLDTGEIERQHRDFDWYNWYHHPTGWDY